MFFYEMSLLFPIIVASIPTKRDHNEIPQLAIEAPRSHDRLAIDYTYDHSVVKILF